MIELYEHAAKLVDYNPETGSVLWRKRSDNKTFNTRFAGLPAGSPNDRGVWKVGLKFDDKFTLISLARLCYFILHDELPNAVVHVDRNKDNFRANNLEGRDKRRAHSVDPVKSNTTGHRGIYTRLDRPGMFTARISVNGNSINLGTFSDINDAIAARTEAEERFGVFE